MTKTAGRSTDVVISCMLDAPREKVWKAWTEPETIRKWWGPKDFTAPAATIDLRVGGTYLYCMRGAPGPGAPKQDFWSTGTFQEIIPMKKIVASDHFADKDGNIISPKDVGMPGEWPEEMLVTVTFEDAGKDTTKLTIVHKGHPKEILEMANAGWNQSLDKFATCLR